MSFLRDLGFYTGVIAGAVVGVPVKVAGKVTGIQLLEDIGDGVARASITTGDTLGKATSGIWDVGAGMITKDRSKIDEGLYDLGDAVTTTISGIGNTLVHVADNSGKVIEGALEGDTEAIKAGARGLITTAAVGALAIGVVDMLVDFDGSDDHIMAQDDPRHLVMEQNAIQHSVTTDETIATDEAVTLTENPNAHQVQPHWRTLPNGTEIWVDGDGDSSVHSYDGWTQSNPDYRSKA